MKKTCLIISGGDFCESLPDIEYDIVIACDKGVEYAEMLSISPDYIIGDFDSLDLNAEHTEELFPAAKIIKLDPKKDDQDNMSAVKLALSLDAYDITVTCCMGGRLDHTLGNIQAGAYCAARGGTAMMLGENERIFIISGTKEYDPSCTFVEYSNDTRPYSGPRSYRITDGSSDTGTGSVNTVSIPRINGWSLSVIALSDICTGVSISGAKYNLTDSDMSNRIPLGISNEWASDEVKVSIKKGILMVICSRMP